MCKLCSSDSEEKQEAKCKLRLEVRAIHDVEEILKSLESEAIKPHGKEIESLRNRAAYAIKILAQYI